MDRGFEFNANQAFQDEAGRWILLGWMSTPDAEYDCEVTMENGWVHAMTIPRELYVNGSGRLCQRPLKELEKMRKTVAVGHFQAGEGFREEVSSCFELKLFMEESDQDFELYLRESVVLRYRDSVLRLDLTGCGAGRGVRGVSLEEVHDLWILSDTSSLEIFVNGGEEVFTARVHDSMEGLRAEFISEQSGGMELYELAV